MRGAGSGWRPSGSSSGSTASAGSTTGSCTRPIRTGAGRWSGLPPERSAMPRQALGRSELEVSRLSLGSWRTFERIPREDGLAVMRAAREHGFNFLDDARYNDETGTAPIPTGYSEVVFGELFRAAGWDRADTVVANKLWWEFWPEQTANAELSESLTRMGFDYVDLIYANPPPDGLGVPEMVAAVGELISTGKARTWGIV